jgi:hypothetical protein
MGFWAPPQVFQRCAYPPLAYSTHCAAAAPDRRRNSGIPGQAARIIGDEERRGLIDHIAANPQSGALMEGTGGARKLRWAVSGRGKSGGPRMPVFVLAAFGKNEKANLS